MFGAESFPNSNRSVAIDLVKAWRSRHRSNKERNEAIAFIFSYPIKLVGNDEVDVYRSDPDLLTDLGHVGGNSVFTYLYHDVFNPSRSAVEELKGPIARA
jgi:hypothetical protein